VDEGYDLAIRIGRLADSSLVAKRIGVTRLIVCASPAYLAAHGRPKTPADLAQHECLLYSYATAGAVWTFSGVSGEESVRVGGRVACNNGDAICAMAIAGLGVVAQPDFIVARHLQSGALEQSWLHTPTGVTGIYAIHPSHRHVPLKLRRFIDQLATAFGDIASNRPCISLQISRRQRRSPLRFKRGLNMAAWAVQCRWNQAFAFHRQSRMSP